MKSNCVSGELGIHFTGARLMENVKSLAIWRR